MSLKNSRKNMRVHAGSPVAFFTYLNLKNYYNKLSASLQFHFSFSCNNEMKNLNS